MVTNSVQVLTELWDRSGIRVVGPPSINGGGGRRRWGMRLGRPEAEVGEEPFDGLGLVNEGGRGLHEGWVIQAA